MELKLTDHLAIERTRLANERTFLAYFRTGVVFFSSGMAVIKLQLFEDIAWIGYILIIMGPILLLIGFIRSIYVKRKIKKYYK